jgi:DtxR family Mn-dependent transcriptional regulator
MSGVAITLLVVAVLATVVVGWPRWGLYARLRARSRRRRRILVEDALKHVYVCQEGGEAATVESLAGVLGIRRGAASELVGLLQRRGFAWAADGTIALTPEGTARALQVVRAHRLSERYLADEAGVPLEQVHLLADAQEHTLTPTETDALDARLSYPRRDPHGDPIPGRERPAQPRPATPLTDWPAGVQGRIVHIEDEPPALFAEILAAGLQPETVVEVVTTGDQRLLLRIDGQERWLPLAAAASISVEPAMAVAGVEPLTVLDPGERGTIVGLRCRGLTRRRLMDLGLTSGTTIEAVLRAALGEPVAYRVRDTQVALRREQATQIMIRRHPAPPGASP